jgi:hypothetical protein
VSNPSSRAVLQHPGRQAAAQRDADARAHDFAVRNAGIFAARTGPGGCLAARNAAIPQMRDLGLSMPEIGRILGITRERVRQILAGIRSDCHCVSCGRNPRRRPA